jgi:chromosome segregation ATPase
LIEQAMYFALGFLVAGLITLLFLPAFWRRALRLSMRRLQMLAPMSMEEVVAERDLLRADFAARERRLEQEMEAIKASKAFDMAAVGRHAARVAQAEARLKQAEADNRDMDQQLREARKVLAERTDLLRSTELALQEMTERADRDVEQLRLLENDKEALGREKEAQYSRVVAHEAKIGALHEQTTQLQREFDALKEEHARVAAEAARVPDLMRELSRTGAELEATRFEKQAFAKERDETRVELAGERERRRNETEHLENALRVARAEARDIADRLESARADNAMLQGAVEALRADRAHQRRAGGPASLAAMGEAPTELDVTALRETLSEFGDRVAQLAERADPPEAQRVL